MPRLREDPARRIVLATDGEANAGDARRALAARGLPSETAELAAAVEAATGVIGFAPQEPPTPERAAAIAPLCARAAESGRPVVIMSAFPAAQGRQAILRAAALAHLRAHGAVLCDDPDVWLETLVLIAAFGVPAGPSAAIVAPPGTWLGAAATALAAEARARGHRFSPVASEAGRVGRADAVLVDLSEWEHAGRSRGTLAVPVSGRAELLGERVALVGLRAALGAVASAGRFAERLAAGLGPDEPESGPAPDRDRLGRQLAKLGERAGDHETKVLCAAYGVEVTRQVVATTPSAAATKAKKVGFPVELKPWSPDAPTELEGCPLERDLRTAAEVRRAFTAIGQALGGQEDAPVIVREEPPPGRELRVRVEELSGLGFYVVVDVLGLPGPVAAPAPLREIDADELARHVAATRAGDPDLDRRALGELLRRLSYLAASEERIASLDVCRIIAGARGERAVVVDARASLRSG